MSAIDEKLLPCPFCGGHAEIVHLDEGDNAGGSCVCCTQCMASGNVEFEFKDNFVSNWNRRALAPQQAAPMPGVDDLAYRFWAIHPKELDPYAETMPKGYKGGVRAWFFATEMRKLLALATPEAGTSEREIAWLIERKDDAVYKQPHWYAENEDDRWHWWTNVAHDAKRFASKAEIEAFPAYQMIASDPAISATEHVFLAALAPQQESRTS